MKPGASDLIRYRITRAKETLDAASDLLREGHLPDAVNRLYYACFYAVSALLFTEGFASTKHTGVRALFDRHWIKTGRLTIEAGKFYRLIFAKRHHGDYDDLIKFATEDVQTWLEQARQFVEEIAKKTEVLLAQQDDRKPHYPDIET